MTVPRPAPQATPREALGNPAACVGDARETRRTVLGALAILNLAAETVLPTEAGPLTRVTAVGCPERTATDPALLQRATTRPVTRLLTGRTRPRQSLASQTGDDRGEHRNRRAQSQLLQKVTSRNPRSFLFLAHPFSFRPGGRLLQPNLYSEEDPPAIRTVGRRCGRLWMTP